ncbi:MAG: sensor histidine kinase [Micrococcales bacterium]|nr:sensor histidine kinase [Micrococcales bacterium]
MTPASAAPDPAADDWERPVSRRDRLVDAGIAALLLACTAITIPLTASAARDAPLWFDIAWAVAITVPLAWRRRYPAAVSVLVTAVFLTGELTVQPEPLVNQIAPFIALYSVGAWSRDRQRAFVVRAALVVAFVVLLAGVAVSAPTRLPAQIGNLSASATLGLAALSSALYLTAGVAFGETAWRSARRRASLEVRTSELVRERKRTAQQAVALERLRIARELHDVVAHHVSVIGLQAGAARWVLDTDSAKASEALSAIEQNARQAVEELHGMLLTLRAEDIPDEPAHATSTLGIDQILDLVRAADRAGTPTSWSVTGDARRLSAATALTLYRVVQEALTNVRKHAGPGARADVRLHVSSDALELRIDDHGGASDSSPSSMHGLGQLGMRERVAAIGGTFEAGPSPEGYRVRVDVPLPS